MPVAPIRALDGVAEDPQLDVRPTLTDIPKPGATTESVKVVSAGHTSAPAPPVVQRPPPELGEHTHEILQEIGYDTNAIERLRTGGCV